MLLEDGALGEEDEQELNARKLQFMINDQFLTTTLQALMEKLQITSESVVELWYTFALDKPKPKISIP